MKLEENVIYTNNTSDLKVEVVSILENNDDNYLVNAIISNKFNGIIYNVGDYRFYKDSIKEANWYKVVNNDAE